MVFKVLEIATIPVIYFGLTIASNRKEEDTFYYKYHLKHRPYLGPTSTEH